MSRYLIRHAKTGEQRVVGDAALPFFPGYVVLDVLDDGLPPTTYYDAASSDFRYVNVTELGDDDSPAMVALRAALVPGSVYENDRTTVSQTKRLHVVLTADGMDIDDLIIEDVS